MGTSTSYTLEGLTLGSNTITVRARKDGVYGYDSVTVYVDVEEFGEDIR